jgi:hypothetical protein
VKFSVHIGFWPILAGGPEKIYAGVIRSKFPLAHQEKLPRPTFLPNFIALAQKLTEMKVREGTHSETHVGT